MMRRQRKLVKSDACRLGVFYKAEVAFLEKAGYTSVRIRNFESFPGRWNKVECELRKRETEVFAPGSLGPVPVRLRAAIAATFVNADHQGACRVVGIMSC